MMLAFFTPAVARALTVPWTPSSLQAKTIQLVMSGCAVMIGPAAVWAAAISPVYGTGYTLAAPAAWIFAFSAVVRSLQTDRVCTSADRTPTFFAESFSQPAVATSVAASSPTLLPMSVPLKPTNGMAVPVLSLIASSVATSATFASAAAFATAGPMVWSGTVIAMPFAPAEIASLTSLMPVFASSFAL